MLTLRGALALQGGQAPEYARLLVRYPPAALSAGGLLTVPAYRFSYNPETQGWSNWPFGGAAQIPGAEGEGDPLTVARFSLTVKYPGLPPTANTWRRRVYNNTLALGEFDLTIPEGNIVTWQGPAVPPAPSPAPGGDGMPGEAGSRWLRGLGVPDAGAGRDDLDWYIDLAGQNVYFKTGGAWVYAFNLRGLPGQDGTDAAGGGGGGVTAPTLPNMTGYVYTASEAFTGGAGWRPAQGPALAMSFNTSGPAYYVAGAVTKFASLRTAGVGDVEFRVDAGSGFGDPVTIAPGSPLTLGVGHVLQTTAANVAGYLAVNLGV